MNDIYEIKLFDIYWFNYLFLVVFILLLLLYFYLRSDKNIKNDTITSILDYKYDGLTYKKIDLIFREYFEYIWVNNAFSKTLVELKKEDINKSIISLFEKNYKMQFSSEKQNKKQNEHILDKLKDILKNEY